MSNRLASSYRDNICKAMARTSPGPTYQCPKPLSQNPRTAILSPTGWQTLRGSQLGPAHWPRKSTRKAPVPTNPAINISQLTENKHLIRAFQRRGDVITASPIRAASASCSMITAAGEKASINPTSRCCCSSPAPTETPPPSQMPSVAACLAQPSA